MVLFRGEQHRPWRTTAAEFIKRRLEQQASDPLPPMIGIYHQIVQGTGGTAQRHVIRALDPAEDVTSDLAVLLRHKHELLFVRCVADQELAIALGEARLGSQEPARVKFIMFLDKQRTEAAESGLVSRVGGPDGWCVHPALVAAP